MRKALSLVLLLLMLYAALAYGIYSGLTQQFAGANDFYSRWVGARALFLHGENPYSENVTHEIQTGMYGRLARPDEDQVAFAYPLYTAFVLAPLIGLPYSQAQALWMAFLIMTQVGGAVMLAWSYRAPLSPKFFAALLICVITFYPFVRGVFLGQLALVSFFCLALAVASIGAHWDIAAGVLLAVATIKPQIAIFILPAILIWAGSQRRWMVIGGAVSTLAILSALALVLVPTWPVDFIQAIRNYSVYEPVGPPVQTAFELISPNAVGLYAGVAAAVALIGWMVWSVIHGVNVSWENFQPNLALVAIVTLWTAGRIGTPDQVLVLFPALLGLRGWLVGHQYGKAALVAAGLIVLPWLVFITTLSGNTEHIGVTLVLPTLALGLYVLRQFNDKQPATMATA